MNSTLEWSHAFRSCLDKQISFVLITLVEVVGSAPQVPGAKAIVTSEGLKAGTVGGGRVEFKAIQYAQNLLRNTGGKSCELVHWNLSKDVGMTCGGWVRFFFEKIQPAHWPIVIFGAGHVAQELVSVLSRLNCHITCLDSRQEWLDRLPSSPQIQKILSANPTTQLPYLPEHAYYILMTQGHKTDMPILHALLQTKNPPYIGVIGSKSKAAIIRSELMDMGIAKTDLQRFVCPIGLPIGDNTPPEIAISIVAQLLQIRTSLLKSTIQKPSQTSDCLI